MTKKMQRQPAQVTTLNMMCGMCGNIWGERIRQPAPKTAMHVRLQSIACDRCGSDWSNIKASPPPSTTPTTFTPLRKYA